MSLTDKLKKSGIRSPKQRTKPLWYGPCSNSPNGGVTFSLLSRFLVCKERFRLAVIEGLRPNDGFNHRLEYGNMFHLCEENYLQGNNWEGPLAEYSIDLCRRYPLQQNDIDKWHSVCKIQFPIYIDYWSSHKDVKNLTPLLQEYTFKVPYTLPSGSTVFLRGKWDSVDLVQETKKTSFITLQENKTKSEVDEPQLRRQLLFDMQTMIYLVALQWQLENPLLGNSRAEALIGHTNKLRGIRYNVIRRPLSGGKGSIVRHKPTKSNPDGESFAEYYERLRIIITEAPQEFFFRWNVTVSKEDINKFRLECLDPILESLVDWYNWITEPELKGNHFSNGGGRGTHFRFPYGVWNPLLEGASTEMDNYLLDGNMTGLRTIDKLFSELE